MDQAQQPRTITLDGTTYDAEQFSQGVQQAVNIYNTINVDLGKAQLEAIKCQAALQTVGMQIAEAVKKELAEKDAPAESELSSDAAEKLES